MVIWNCSHPSNKQVTPTVSKYRKQVNIFIDFMWLQDHEIGEVPHTWNWLTDWYEETEKMGHPRALHYTAGGPWLEKL